MRKRKVNWMVNHMAPFTIPDRVLKSHDIIEHLCDRHLISGGVYEQGDWEALEDFLSYDMRIAYYLTPSLPRPKK